MIYSIYYLTQYMFSSDLRTCSYMFSSTKKQSRYCTQYNTVQAAQYCSACAIVHLGRVMSRAGNGELPRRARSSYAARAARLLRITPLTLRACLPSAVRAARSRLAALALRARIKNYCSTQETSKTGEREPSASSGWFKGVRAVTVHFL